jgi:hypothetical protein
MEHLDLVDILEQLEEAMAEVDVLSESKDEAQDSESDWQAYLDELHLAELDALNLVRELLPHFSVLREALLLQDNEEDEF